MDFVTKLYLSQDYNAIFVHKDHLTKYTKFMPFFIEEDLITVDQVVLLFFQNVVLYFGIPTSVTHDRDPRFASDFW